MYSGSGLVSRHSDLASIDIFVAAATRVGALFVPSASSSRSFSAAVLGLLVMALIYVLGLSSRVRMYARTAYENDSILVIEDEVIFATSVLSALRHAGQ